jgi:hypothetical protein
VLGIARSIREDGAFDRLPILADALMDAGCADEAVIGHCRSNLPHFPECWVVDSLGPGRPPQPRHRSVSDAMAAVARYVGSKQPNLATFGRTGVLRDLAHQDAAMTELADLIEQLGRSAQEGRSLARLRSILTSAPVGVRFFE